jgi:hypothetical protein
MATRETMLVLLGQRIQDSEEVLSAEARSTALREALKDYQRYRPRRLVTDIIGNGGSDYPLPSSWVMDQSLIDSIEFPYGDVPPVYLDEADYVLYQSVSTTVLRLLTVTPSVTQTLRILFTTQHQLTETTSSIPASDEAAVANKAASLCCLWLAAHYAQQGQATVRADSTQHDSKVRQYRDLSKDFLELYHNHLGIGDDVDVAAASAVLDWDNTFSWGAERLTHPRSWA